MGIDSLKRARAVFLDRDGVLNRATVIDGKPHPPHRLEELELLPGVREPLVQLRQAGFLLIVVTNQPDIARGSLSAVDSDKINGRLAELLPVHSVRVCPHDDGDGCHCRKPLPGLIHDAADEFAIDVTRSFMVGDRWRDIEAGRSAGCTTVLIDYAYHERRSEPHYSASNLSSAADWILRDIKEHS